MSINSLEQKFRQNTEKGRKTLIPFLPGGYPTKEKFWEYILAMDRLGADIIEIGVPFSDPVADGEVVERASNVCLKNGINLVWILNSLKHHRKKLSSEIVLMGYCNPFYKYGWEKLAKDASSAGVSGIIVADLPLEESENINSSLKSYGISLVYLIGLNTSLERMNKYASVSTGFVYFVSVLGTTGAREKLPEELKEKIRLAREVFSQPIALGFGIKEPSQLREIKDWIDGIVFGSSLIQHIDDKAEVESFFKKWT